MLKNALGGQVVEAFIHPQGQVPQVAKHHHDPAGQDEKEGDPDEAVGEDALGGRDVRGRAGCAAHCPRAPSAARSSTRSME